MRARATALERNRAGWLTRQLTGPYAVVLAEDCAGTAPRAWIGELLSGGAQTWACTIPWTTLVVNLAGAFLLELLAGLLARRFSRADPRVRLLLGTGFLSSFTAYSMFTAEVEAVTTAQAATYATGSIACGLPCVWGGLSLGARAGRGSARQRSAGRRDQLADEPEPEASA